MNYPASNLLVRVKNLKKHFYVRETFLSRAQCLKAIDGVTFCVPSYHTVGIVGESGSGKTTLGRTMLRMVEPTNGAVYFNGVNITEISKKELFKYRPRMQMMSQDPYNALHPRKLVKNIVGEGLKIHNGFASSAIYERVKDVLEKVGLKEEHMFRYPHEFSGGQRQRISVARSLILKPEFLILDEPTSALDVSVQAVILKLMQDLKKEFALTYIFITHDLAVIDYVADDVLVMYLGQIVEMGSKENLFRKPSHPYTQILLNSVLSTDPKKKIVRDIPKGEIPSLLTPPPGCRFHTRCPFVRGVCRRIEPKYILLNKNHQVKCHFPLNFS